MENSIVNKNISYLISSYFMLFYLLDIALCMCSLYEIILNYDYDYYYSVDTKAWISNRRSL